MASYSRPRNQASTATSSATPSPQPESESAYDNSPNMRDILVTLIFFGSMTLAFKRPYVAALLWVWGRSDESAPDGLGLRL